MSETARVQPNSGFNVTMEVIILGSVCHKITFMVDAWHPCLMAVPWP